MFHAGNIQGITKYILLSALALSSECFAAVNREYDQINVSTREPLENLNSNTTKTPESIEKVYPCLYYSTIVFGVIIVGIAFLMILQTCGRFCPSIICITRSSSAGANRLRHTLIETDPLLINGRFKSTDRPPSYDSVTLPSIRNTTIEKAVQKDERYFLSSESPPPSYTAVVFE